MDANLKIAAAVGNKLKEEIPEELIEDILLRLPVKSLIRFGFVCKSWLSWISSNQFARKHLYSNSNSKSFRCAAVLPQDLPLSGRLPSNSIFSISSSPKPQDEERVTALTAPVGNKIKDIYIWGHCEGLLLLVVDYDNKISTIIWNPTINKYRILPALNSYNDIPNVVLGGDALGLGYDPSIDDYKVVWVRPTRVYVLTLKTNTWRRVDNVLNEPVQSVVPTDQFVCDNNGGVYWNAKDRLRFGYWNADDESGLLRFDLAEEKFRLIPTPPNTERGIDDDVLTIVQVSLGLPSTNSLDYVRVYENSNKVWVANPQTNWNWMKCSTMSSLHCSRFERGLLGLTRSGKILFMPNNVNFAIYDPDQNSVKKLAMPQPDVQVPRFTYHAIPYIQSLVSP